MVDDLQAVHEAHVRRITALDPLVGVSELPTSADAQVIWPSDGSRDAVGVALVVDVDPGLPSGLWSTSHGHRLAVRFAHEPTAGVLADLLDQWLVVVGADPLAGDLETSAGIGLASRDLAALAALSLRHFAPASVLAVRRRGGASVALGSAERWAGNVEVREAEPGDLEPMVDLAVHLHEFEARSGAVPERPDAGEVQRLGLHQQLTEQPGWSWVAVHHGEVVGMCVVSPPDAAAWVAGSVRAEPAAYLASMVVRPRVRGAGIGSALVEMAHRRADSTGVGAMLLHFGATNPLSAPFWAAHGYRPLVTSWQRRPAVLR